MLQSAYNLRAWGLVLAAILAVIASASAQEGEGWRSWGAAEGLPESFVSAIAVSPEGTVWAIHGSSGISRMDGGVVAE